MEKTLSKKTFKRIILVMFIVIIIFAGVITAVSLGLPEKVEQIFSGEGVSPDAEYDDETGPWGYLSWEWIYDGVPYSFSYDVTKDEYKSQNSAVYGLNRPDDLEDYIAYDQLTSELADYLSIIVNENAYNDRQAVDLVSSFVSAIPYLTDEESGHLKSYPRLPLVTLTDYCGDSEDHTILMVSLLRNMGYTAVIAWYPASLDRNTLIPEAAAAGIVSDDESDGPVYQTKTENVTIPVKTIWTVDTILAGYPKAAYNGQTPVIVNPDVLLTGNTAYTVKSSGNPALIEIVGQVHGGPLVNYPVEEHWREDVLDYYKGVWIPSHLILQTSGHWELRDIYLTVKGDSVPLYTAEQTAEFTTTVPWRMCYTINKINTTAESAMSPFANLDIALFRDNGGKPELLEIFGWQGHDDADSEDTSKVYMPGKYLISVFSRNVEAELFILKNGKTDVPAYSGGI